MNVLTSILLICAAGLSLAWLVAAQRRLVASVARRFVRLPRLQQVLLVLAVGVMTVCAQKSGTNEVSNAEVGETQRRGEEELVTTSSSPSFSILRVNAPQTAVTTNDIARGYAFVEARTNATVSCAMPTNGTVVGTWHKTGAYEDVVRVKLTTEDFSAENGDLRMETRSSSQTSATSNDSGLRAKNTDTAFAFPLGDVCATFLWAYTRGKVRPRLRDKVHEIVAVGAPMSCVPGEGRLWVAPTTNGSWLITWENFRAGRTPVQGGSGVSPLQNEEVNILSRSDETSLPPSSVISAQVEFFPNGDFITRSNDFERVYRRVNPDDWDDDGIANEVDADPLVAADTPQFGPNQDLSVVEHEENYCWIDLVVPQANAKVTFVGDGASNLADPSFIAKAGETNRVTLLIGKPYVATCVFPFEIVGQSSASIDVRRPNDRRAEVCWPVTVALADGSGASFGMTVQPSSLVGTFFWTNYCCGVSGKSNSFSYLCARNNCCCTGCSALGFFRYEGFFVSCVGGTCGCLPSGGPLQDPASVSVSFSKDAIIFEDAYDNSPTEHVGWRSTETVLSCSASGGGKGGFLYVYLEDEDRLVRYGGQSLPYSKALAANETISFTCRYRATKASDAEGDIKVTATFAENETGTKQSAETTVTAIQIMVTPFAEAPQNKSMGRHRYGVCEDVVCRQSPSAPVVTWVADKGAVDVTESVYHCPIQAAANPLSASCGGAEYVPQITIVEPDEVKVRNPDCSDLGAPVGEAGSLVMFLPLYIGPFDVAFYGIAVEEVPYDDVPWTGDAHMGYFSRKDLATWWHHTRENGAGEWVDVEEDNYLGGEGAHDCAGVTRTLSRVTDSGLFVDDPSCRWADGVINFGTPFGWNKRGTTGNAAPYSRFAENARAELILLEDGTFTVRKLGNEATRYVDGRMFLNGEQKK